MIIRCPKQMDANQQVNRLGKCLYKYLDSAFKYTTSSNTCDVYFMLLYQIPGQLDVQEMSIDISITTYQNKIRVNVIEISPEEKTLDCQVYTPEQLEDFSLATKVIFNKIIKRVEKVYQDFEILY